MPEISPRDCPTGLWPRLPTATAAPTATAPEVQSGAETADSAVAAPAPTTVAAATTLDICALALEECEEKLVEMILQVKAEIA